MERYDHNGILKKLYADIIYLEMNEENNKFTIGEVASWAFTSELSKSQVEDLIQALTNIKEQMEDY